MKRWAVACASMVAPLTATAQTAPPAPASVTAAVVAPVDPVRLAAARPVIDQIWPMGTYARLMQGMVDQMTQGMLAGIYDMKPQDLVPGGKKVAADAKGRTLAEMAAANDPYFRQRTDIMMKVMFGEMGKLMTEVEPQVRDGLAGAYARRFSVAELGDLHRFFATPTGRAYASDSMMLMMGPDMMKAMQSLTPKLIQAMPGILVKVQEATKDLPPPPKKKDQAK